MKKMYHSEIQTLKAFYHNLFSWHVSDIGCRICCFISNVVLFLFMLNPLSLLELKELWLIPFLFCMASSYTYLAPYLRFFECGRACNLYRKIKYLPISLQALRLFLVKKITLFSLKMTILFLVAQLSFTWLFYRIINWENIVMPILFGLVIPIGFAGLTILFATRE